MDGSDISRRQAKSGGGRPSMYKLADGTRVPSCTTITKRFANSDGLINWAWQQGADGKSLNDARDKAAGIGSIVHDAVELYVCGATEADSRALITKKAEDFDAEAKATDGFDAFLEWWSGCSPEMLVTEQPLVSETHRFGGTLDAIGRVNGRLCLIDWKTSSALYVEYLCQLAAYALLWNEHTGDKIEAFHLLRFSKVTGSFTHFAVKAERIKPALEYFLWMRKGYEMDKRCKDLLK